MESKITIGLIILAFVGALFYVASISIPALNEAIWHTSEVQAQQQQEYDDWWNSLTPEEQLEIERWAYEHDRDLMPDSRYRYLP